MAGAVDPPQQQQQQQQQQEDDGGYALSAIPGSGAAEIVPPGANVELGLCGTGGSGGTGSLDLFSAAVGSFLCSAVPIPLPPLPGGGVGKAGQTVRVSRAYSYPISSHHMSPHLTLSHLISSHLTSPHPPHPTPPHPTPPHPTQPTQSKTFPPLRVVVPASNRFEARIQTFDTLAVPVIRGSVFTLHLQSSECQVKVGKLLATVGRDGERVMRRTKNKPVRPRFIARRLTAEVRLETLDGGLLCMET